MLQQNTNIIFDTYLGSARTSAVFT